MARSLPTAEEASRILARRRSRPPRRPPAPAGRLLSKYLAELEARFGPGAGPLTTRWREIVGDTLARRTEPVKLVKARNGAGAVLELRVDGPAAALIQHQAPDILARVNLYLGAGAVSRLRIVQGPVRPSAAAAGPAAAAKARRRASAPLDAAEEANLAASLDAAPDGPLKASLLKLGRAVLRHS
ncbi:MAG TPA: DciA family protein [Caulobacteraceae bacterium]|nr:DciA family protein [Caulobacteraceae bacterium]